MVISVLHCMVMVMYCMRVCVWAFAGNNGTFATKDKTRCYMHAATSNNLPYYSAYLCLE